jgi:hypothetical protein
MKKQQYQIVIFTQEDMEDYGYNITVDYLVLSYTNINNTGMLYHDRLMDDY